MASVCSLLLWTCALGFGTFVQGKNVITANTVTSKELDCDYKIRVIFTSDKWTTNMDGKQLPRDIIQDQFFVKTMHRIAISTQERGINCTFDESSYEFTCCDSGILGHYGQVNRKELTASQKFWGYDISNVNFVLLFVNLFFFMTILSCGLLLSIKYPETLVPLGLDEITESS